MTSTAFSRSLALVRAIMLGRKDIAAELIGAASFDADGFVSFLERETIASAMFHAAQYHLMLTMLPPQCVEALRRWFLTNQRWNLLILARISDIEAALRRRNREVIVLKGLPLAQQYYGQLAARQIGDIDLLVEHAEQLRDFEAILEELGYRRRSRILGDRSLMTRYTHHMEFSGPHTPLDFHWALRRHSTFAIDYRELWRNKQRIAVRKAEMLALSPEYELVLGLLSIHNDIQLKVNRLKAFVDLHAILAHVATALDWPEFLRRRTEEGLLGIAVNVLDLMLSAFDCAPEFPTLAESLRTYRRRVVFTDAEAKLSLLDRSCPSWRRRTWALRLYDASPARAVWWWGVSLPFRLAEHRER